MSKLRVDQLEPRDGSEAVNVSDIIIATKNVSFTCSDIATLRTIEPTNNGQRVTLLEHTAGSGLGGGIFVYDNADTTSVYNYGTVIVPAVI